MCVIHTGDKGRLSRGCRIYRNNGYSMKCHSYSRKQKITQKKYKIRKFMKIKNKIGILENSARAVMITRDFFYVA